MSPTLLVLATVLGVALASMPVFAVVRRGRRDADAERKGSRFLLGVGDFLVHWFMWAIGPAGAGAPARGGGPRPHERRRPPLRPRERRPHRPRSSRGRGRGDRPGRRVRHPRRAPGPGAEARVAVRQVHRQHARPLRRDLRLPRLRRVLRRASRGPARGGGRARGVAPRELRAGPRGDGRRLRLGRAHAARGATRSSRSSAASSTRSSAGGSGCPRGPSSSGCSW